MTVNFVTALGVVSREPKVFGTEYKRTTLTVGGIQRVGDRDTIFLQSVSVGGDEGKFAAQIPAGTPVIVTGNLRHETWTDANTGEKKSKTYLRATSVRRVHNPEAYEVEERVSPGGDPYFLLKGGYVSITVSGNLSRAELRYLPNGTPVLGGSFAAKEEWIQNGETREHTNWLNFQVWGDRAVELAEAGIGKGWGITVIDGVIRNSSSQSKKDGKRYENTSVEVGSGRMDFFPKRGGGGGSTSLDIDSALDLELPVEEALPF